MWISDPLSYSDSRFYFRFRIGAMWWTTRHASSSLLSARLSRWTNFTLLQHRRPSIRWTSRTLDCMKYDWRTYDMLCFISLQGMHQDNKVPKWFLRLHNHMSIDEMDTVLKWSIFFCQKWKWRQDFQRRGVFCLNLKRHRYKPFYLPLIKPFSKLQSIRSSAPTMSR